MARYMITRHQAAAEWAMKQGFGSVEIVTHADAAFWAGLEAGDVVIGTLPIHLAAKACAKTGKAFGFLSLNVPPELRGQELTLDQMESCNASIEWFEITPVAGPEGA